MEKTKRSGSWEEIYKKGSAVYKYYDILKPHPDIKKVSDILKKSGARKVLDLGCGAGRNLLYLADKGFDLCGIDSSLIGLKTAKMSLKHNKLKAKLKVGDVFKKLPYESDLFDAVISVQVLEHSMERGIKSAIKEMRRVLKTNGLIFIALCGRYSEGRTRYCLVKTAKKIVPRVYIPTIGDEVGDPHYIYNIEAIRKHYADFKIVDIWRDNKDYYCFIARKK